MQTDDQTSQPERLGQSLAMYASCTGTRNSQTHRGARAELPESFWLNLAIENHACVARHRATRGTVHPGWQWLRPPSSTGALVEGEVAAVGLVARSGGRVGCARRPGRRGLQCGAVARAID